MLQEQKKSKEPTHLIKHDLEVIKPSGKTGRLIKVEYWDRSFQMSELLVQKKETDKCTLSYLLLCQERLLLWWSSGRASRGIAEILSKTVNVDVGSRQSSPQQKVPSRPVRPLRWHIRMAQNLSVILGRSRSTTQQPYLSCLFHGLVKINPLYNWGWNAEPLFFFHDVCFQAGYVSVPRVMWVTFTVKHWQRMVF